MNSQPLMEDEIDFRGLLHTLWRRRRTILILSIVSAAIAAGLSFFVLPPQYESRTQILLSEKSAAAYATSESAARILTGLAFLEPIAGASAIPTQGRSLQGLVKAMPIRETRIVDLRIRHEDPETLRTFTNAVVEKFMGLASERVEQRREAVENRLAAVDAQLKELEGTVRATRRTLERLEMGVPTDTGSWFARLFILNSAGTAESLYTELLNTQRELRDEALGLEFPALIQAPYIPPEPVSPRPLFNITVATALGFLIGLIIVLAVEAVQSPSEVPLPAQSGSASSLPLGS